MIVNGQIYSKYLIVYLDVLGFKEMINKSEGDPNEQTRIMGILQRIKKISDEITKIKDMPSPDTTIFSDTILLSYKNPDIESLITTITSAALFELAIIEEGGFLRGAAIIDNNYQSENIIFGPALVKAYEMETKLATWPRVIVHNSVLNYDFDISDEELKKHFFSTARQFSNLAITNKSKTSIENNPKILDDFEIYFKEHISDIRTQLISSIKKSQVNNFFHRGEDGIVYIDYLNINFLTITTRRWVKEIKKEKLSKDLEKNIFSSHKNSIINTINALKQPKDIGLLSKYHALAVNHNRNIQKLYKCFSSQFNINNMAQNPEIAYFYNSFYLGMLGEAADLASNDVSNFICKKFDEFYSKRDELFLHKMINLSEVFPELYML